MNYTINIGGTAMVLAFLFVACAILVAAFFASAWILESHRNSKSATEHDAYKRGVRDTHAEFCDLVRADDAAINPENKVDGAGARVTAYRMVQLAKRMGMNP